MKIFKTSALAILLVSLAACGGTADPKTGTLKLMANGEDFVREGFISEDGWSISFEAVYLNVESPTAYQVVEESQNALTIRHGGHPHEYIPEGSAHVALLGEYFLSLKQEAFEVGRDENAPIGNYNRLAFNVKKATTASQGLLAAYEGYSIVLAGTATKDSDTIDFLIKFDEEMSYSDCGPNEYAGVLAEDGQAMAEMTFHFDHVFGDFDEGDPDPEDENTINYLAIGFGPFAELAQATTLDIDQAQLGELLTGAVYLQLIDAVRTLGHSGEAHCHYE
ncbi:MAG: DUF4382 domain-containing protein [Deltaproteobacteria bacterium]|nr:DUF4382 domain-containing protein [Deltaproteobacteria bacterium]